MADLAIDPFPYVTAGLNALGGIVKLTDDELAYLNSPMLLTARKLAQEQAVLEKDDADLKACNLSEIDRESSG